MNKKYQFVSESLLLSEKNTIYNFTKWKQSKNDLLFITGYVGSGKSTIGKEISRNYNSNYISLDDWIEKEVNKFQNIIKKMYDNNEITEVQKLYQKIVDNSIDKLFKKIKKKTVIEGIQIFFYSKPEKFKNYSIIVVGTSALVSMIRAIKRNLKDKEYVKKFGIFGVIDDVRSNLFIKKVEFFRKLVKTWKKKSINK